MDPRPAKQGGKVRPHEVGPSPFYNVIFPEIIGENHDHNFDSRYFFFQKVSLLYMDRVES
jgi:hypothetical protein